MFRTIVASIMLLAAAALSYAQDSYDMKLTDTLTVVSTQYVQKRYSLYFEKGSSRVDKSYHDNGRVLEKMKSDIRTTLNVDKVIPDSLLILSTASPDGSVFLNRRLAEVRAANTKKLLLQMFPEFKDATILVDYVEENWDGLRQVLKTDPDFPQRDRMLAIIDETVDVDDKEAALKACEEGWAHLVDSHIYSLRTSSVTLCVILDGVVDEFVRMVPVNKLGQFSYTPVFEAADVPMKDTRTRNDHVWKKMILAPRMNLLAAGFNIGLEIPIKDHWSVGMDYYFPWLLDKGNRWCVQFLGGGCDAKYWFSGSTDRVDRLQGHAVGVYAGAGLYDLQNSKRGAQGEFFDVGVDYTYSLPLAKGKLRMEFNLGLGFLRTWYRPYYPSSDYADLIKEPGIRYNSTDFFGPTKVGVSLVVPIVVKTNAPKACRKGGQR